MFFFGALSGNLVYLILAISYLAGCSAIVLGGAEDQQIEPNSSESAKVVISYRTPIPQNFASVYSITSDNFNQDISDPIVCKIPANTYFAIPFIPPHFKVKHNLSVATLFSRPPPFSFTQIV